MPGNTTQPSIFTPRDQFGAPPEPNTSATTSPTTSRQYRLPPSSLAQRRLAALATADDQPPLLTIPDQHSSCAVCEGEQGNTAAIVTISEADVPTTPHESAQTAAPEPVRRKRPLDPPDAVSKRPELLSKRKRLNAHQIYKLDSLSFRALPEFQSSINESSPSNPSNPPNPPSLLPPSPLFFSHSPRPRPQLPPRFSSSEAGARMLSKARTEDSQIKTVSLTRGTVSASAVPTSAPATSSSVIRRSLERSSIARSDSPDSSNGRDITSGNISPNLHAIGILELLEQDGRPTFVVDLSDSANYGPGPLVPTFTNLSLRATPGLQESITGISEAQYDADAPNFLQFKSWLLSATVNGESLNVCLPPFTFAGLSWSCSTLRKRLRVISALSYRTEPVSGLDQMSRSGASTADTPANQIRSSPHTEPSDYFGRSPFGVRPANGSATSNPPSEVRSTIEAARNRSPFLSDLGTPPQKSDESGRVSASIRDIIDGTHNDIGMPLVSLPSFDWTRIPINDSMSEHIRFARSVDWAATALGPIENWGPDLRQMCNLIMASPHPAAMYWGDDMIAIYNEAYVMLAGQKHPELMGQSYRVAWAELWDDVKDVFASAKSTGEATMKDDDCLFMKRNNYLEETYFSWSIIPMLGEDGSVMGLYNPAFEKTRRKIAERRMLTLREVGERTASARDVKGFWSQVLASFDFNEHDSPFLLLYSVDDESDSDTASSVSLTGSLAGSRYCLLEGALGVPEDHPAAQKKIEMRSGMEGFGPVFREIIRTDKPVLLEVGSKDLPEHLVENLQCRGFGDPVRGVVVCPIHPTTGETVLGFLVLGINPRRPYDDDYSLFVQLLSRQLATSLASVVLFEEEIRRGQRAARLAALDRIELSEQLAARTKEAYESETKFTRMAEFAPVGMFIADSEGNVTFANDAWYVISGVQRGEDLADKWMDAIATEDQPLVEEMWHKLVKGTQAVSGEFRYKVQWEDRNGAMNHTWVLFSAYPEQYEDGKLKSVFGSITNISQQKWAEGLQTRKMKEAMELKRQQENFIDITSHEMRNPLSAILQCADEITTSMTKLRKGEGGEAPGDIIISCLEAAQTISLCSQHQKRIVDDVLTLSKLDSQLLLVTPVDAQPLTVVQRALKMHEGELQAADIQMRFVVDQSFKDLSLDWLRFDPSRVLQVLINLTTNAIKFTTTERRRTITVSIAASRERPSDLPDAPVKYIPSRSKSRSVMHEKDWGDGETVFVHFAVRDTGRGLDPEEKKMLFLRFSQASPRTHVQYGGSGLGLFISRELTELQGGEIGVASEAGKGSTFAFYIAAKRSVVPPDSDPASTMMQRFAGDSKTKKSSTTAVKADAKTVPRKVLIVEDNLVNQRVLQKQLKNMGTEVHLANHGGEAIEKLMQSTYWTGPSEHEGERLELGVVLMDQEMPVMDGLTCTRKIRELEQEGKLSGHVPIIAVTANARQEQIQTALDAGMDDVVSKPFRIPDLLPKIEELQLRYPMPSS